MGSKEKIVEWLERHRDDGTVKVLTGLRGTGKSTAVDCYCKRLVASGVSSPHIITIDFGSSIYRSIRTTNDTLALIDAYTLTDDRYYVFIDEPFDAEGFGELAERLRSRKNLDLTVISSNARVLSSLRGNATTFEVRSGADAFPHLQELKKNRQQQNDYMEGLWSTIFLRDVAVLDKAVDCRLMEHIAEYLTLHLGEATSLRQIGAGAALLAGGRAPAPSTISEYFTVLLNSHLFSKALRFDIFNHETNNRGYRVFSPCPDLLARRFGPISGSYAALNRIWNCLRSKWHDVFTGRTANSEIDFVTRTHDQYAYFQYIERIESASDIDRLTQPFAEIDDDFPRTLIVGRPTRFTPPDGVSIVTLDRLSRDV